MADEHPRRSNIDRRQAVNDAFDNLRGEVRILELKLNDMKLSQTLAANELHEMRVRLFGQHGEPGIIENVGQMRQIIRIGIWVGGTIGGVLITQIFVLISKAG